MFNHIGALIFSNTCQTNYLVPGIVSFVRFFHSTPVIYYNKYSCFQRRSICVKKKDFIEKNRTDRKLEDVFKILKPFQSYFHDGSIIDISYNKNDVKISLESAEICDIINIPLSIHKTIKGNLYIKNPELILLDKKNTEINLTMMADSAGIIKFELEENKVRFFVEWNSYPPDDRKTVKYSDIVFIAQQIFWENVPDLYDPLREVKRDRIL